MINIDFMIENLAELIIIVSIIYYWLIRYWGKKHQKNEGWDNFEWWAYRALYDLYKSNWYPNPALYAKDNINFISKNIKKWL
jgi:hypothetical protein